MSYKVIPQIHGPTLRRTTVCLFLLEDGSGFIQTEDGSGFLQLEMCNQPTASSFLIELEDGSGNILLENGLGYIELEVGP